MRKRMKQIVALFMAALMVAGCSAGCGKKEDTASDATTLNVRVWRMGFGDEYVNALAEAFEEAYKEEGYKINIVSSDSNTYGSTVVNEMLLGEANGIDMYFTNSITPTMLVNNSQENAMDMIAADLTDVYESKAIGSDKKEENVTISDKLREEYRYYFTYNGDVEECKGKMYCFPLHTTPAGLVVNEELLQSYGLELPKTTNEYLKCYEVIAAKTAATGVYPTAWAGHNAASYWRYLTDVWVAQYSGVDYYNKFLTMEYSDDVNEGWKVYEDQSWVESLTVLETLVHPDYAPNKTISMDHTTAQYKFLNGEAVFMANGAWLENEMSANYENETWNVKMMLTPVISALGVKLGLDGNGGKDSAKCETVLSQVVGLVDDNKSTDDIIAAVSAENGVTLTSEQVEAVREARGVFYDKSTDEEIVVNAFSKKLDVVKLFLRFIASDEGAQIILDKSLTYSAFASTTELQTEGTSEFMQSVNKIAQRENVQAIFRQPSGLRSKLNIALFNEYGALEKEIAAAKGKLKADKIMQEELAYVQSIWQERMDAYNK